VLGCGMVYLALFAVGRFVLGAHAQGLLLALLSAMCAFALRANLRRSWSEPSV
jgi:hypothetical protein